MVKLSKEFPTIKFTLEGEGEEPGDLWKAYFLGGKKQVCKFDEFDPEKLE